MLIVKDFLDDQTLLKNESQNKTPFVSVILPTYKRKELLEHSIRSVLSQTFRDFELIVLDDGSTDGSYDVIERLRAGDDRITHVRHEYNSGLPALRVNEGIELANGQFVAFQFDDDMWNVDFLETLTDAAIGFGQSAITLGKCQVHIPTGEFFLPEIELTYANFYKQNRIANNSVLMPRKIFRDFGMFDCHIAMKRLCDWDLWLRLINFFAFNYIDKVISNVFGHKPDAVGMTTPFDLQTFRLFNGIDRNNLLNLSNWHSYQVDALRIGDIEITGDIRDKLYNEHLVNYYNSIRPKNEPYLLLHKYTSHIDALNEKMILAERGISKLRDTVQELNSELIIQQKKTAALSIVQQKLDITEQELGTTQQKLDVTEQELINIKSDNIRFQEKISSIKTLSINAVNELAGMRDSRISRLIGRFRRSDLLPLLNPAFQQLLDDSYLFQNVKGFLLQPSVSFQKEAYLGYRLELNRPGLCGIWIAHLLDIPLQQGVVGVELVSPENKIVLQQVVSVSDLREDTPGHFIFEPIIDTQQGEWEIRIFARDVEGPIRLVEWRKYALGGLGRLKTRAFFGFDFSRSQSRI